MRFQREIELINGRKYIENVNCEIISLDTQSIDGVAVFIVEVDKYTTVNVPKHAILTETIRRKAR